MPNITRGSQFQITPAVWLHTYYNRTERTWWAYYMTPNGDQLGDA
jgi:hypothetical protein